MTRALKMIHDTDPKALLMAATTPYLDGITLPPYRFIVGVYKRPEKLASGLYLPETAGPRKEDSYQGKVGLILKMGPRTFAEDATHQWDGTAPKVGDWIVYNVGDAWAFDLGDTRCRWLHEDDWRMTTTEPDWFY